MKFLWESNAPWAGTGYGAQTRLLLRTLWDAGHEPHCFCFYGLSGGCIEYDGYTCWPNSDYNQWGNDVVKIHTRRSGAEVLVTLMDLFVLDKGIYEGLKVPWVAWVPIDHEDIGPGTLNVLKVVDYPIAMSNFGAKQMLEKDVEPLATIYHAVDTEVFKPLDKAECRRVFEFPDEFMDAWVIGMVMANKGDRKQYPQQLAAVRKFMDENPDLKVMAFIHTEPTAAMGGWDMKELINRSGLHGKVWATNQYDASVVPIQQDMMAKLFNCFDVLMNCSAGEGFGIPIVEAQACGVPVITGSWTAMSEITHNGYTVEPAAKILGGHFGWQFIPDIEDMVYRLNSVYRMANSAQAAAGRAWVEANCSLPVVTKQWEEVLEYAATNGKQRPKTLAQLPKDYALDES